MKKGIFFSPLVAAVFFTIPESWLLITQQAENYIPVIFELMLLVLGYLAALGINLVIVLPANLLLLMKTLNLSAGPILAFFIALIGTTVAYAFEIFGYRASILEPEYLYPIFIPLFLLSLITHYYLRLRRISPAVDSASKTAEKNESQESKSDSSHP